MYNTLSLYDMVAPLALNNVGILRLNKATLVHLSYTLEDIVLKNKLPALMFTGFQESSHWAQATERYNDLVDVAKQVCIFAGKALPPDAYAKAIQIKLGSNDPLRQEWFVLILAKEFSVLLCGKDQGIATKDESLREFDTVLSFDIEVIDRVVTQLEGVLTTYRPDLVAPLRDHYQSMAPVVPNSKYLMTVISSLTAFEVSLNRALVHANAALRHERDYNKQIIENSPNFVSLSTLDGKILMINPAMERALGIQSRDIVGKAMGSEFIHPDDYPQLVNLTYQLYATGKSFFIEMRLLSVNGQTYNTEWTFKLLSDGDNDDKFVMGVGKDITAQKHAQELQYAQDLLRLELQKERELSNIRSQLMTTISHEFRTPLSIILLTSELLLAKRHQLAEDVYRGKVKRIAQQVFHITEMLDNIIDIVNAESGILKVEPQPLNCVVFLQELLSGLQKSDELRHQVIFNHDYWTTPEIQADSRLIRVIVSNLMSNAFKYSPIGSEVRICLQPLNAEQFTIAVSDKGSGIPEQDQEYIFTPFYRGANAITTSGIGLGLQLVADSLRIYGGTIDYQTGDNGTTFTITLPYL